MKYRAKAPYDIKCIKAYRSQAGKEDSMSVYDYTVKDNNGEEISLSEFKGKVLLIVNTATKCGFTPQYDGLEALFEKYGDRGFTVLDFPCNQFAFQAPGSNEKIDSFCRLKYSTRFPRFSKIKVNGEGESALYTYLKSKKEGRIKWNFTKFLIDRNGEVVERYPSSKKPEELAADIERELEK